MKTDIPQALQGDRACITDRLNLSVRSQANVVTRELGMIGGRANHTTTKKLSACGQTLREAQDP